MSQFYLLNYLIYIAYGMVFACLAAMTVHYISPFAAGSGIPETKSILSGLRIGRFISFKTLLAKVLGLIAGFAAQLSIGKEGPFIHCSVCIANVMMKRIPFFKYIREVPISIY